VERDPDVAGAFRFRHALIRDAAYEGLSYRRRRELHGRVGDAIAQAHGERSSDLAENLAFHFQTAERWPETWRFSVLAGRRAEEKYANVEAAQFFAQALDAAKRAGDVPADEIAAVATALGDVRVLLGRYEAATAAFRIAEDHLGEDPVKYAQLAEKRHWVPFRLGKHSQALRWLTRGLAELEDVDGEEAIIERARLMAAYATVRQVQRRPLDAIEWARKAIAETERSPGRARAAEAAAYYILDWAYVTLGRTDEAVYGEQSLQIYQEIGAKRRISAVLNHLAMRAYLDGRWSDCLELAKRAQDASTAIGDRWAAAADGFNIGETLADQGRFEEAATIVRKSMTVWHEDGAFTDAAEAASLLGRIVMHLGEFDESKALLTDAIEVFRESGDEVEELKAEGRLAYLALLTGDPSDAIAEVEAALEKARRQEGVASLTAALERVYGAALVACGRIEEARNALEESIRLARSPGANFGLKSPEYEVGETYRALAKLPGLAPEEAADYAAKGLAILEPFGVIVT
jgi:tetratricopeptide (TPR) repeat protein